jgi:hypothetical protein
VRNTYKDSATGPLSFSEEAAWNEYVTDPKLFFMRGAVLSADLAPGAGLKEARKVLADISARHEIFRTAYDVTAGRPARQVLPAYQHKVMEADAPVYPVMGNTSALSPDDLARVWLTPGGDGRMRLTIDMNEMITDSWSCARLHPELEAMATSPGSPLPGLNPPPAGYSDFAREQRDRELPDELTDYWRSQLASMAPPEYLDRDGPDPSGDVAGERVVIFSDDMTGSLRALCRRLRLSPFMAAVAVVKMLLSSRSGVRDITLTTMTGTRASRWTDVQGNFSNVVLLRSVLPENPSFSDVLAMSRAGVIGALQHHGMPFLQLSDVLGEPVALPPIRVQFLAKRAHHYRMLDSRPSGDAWIEDAVFAGFPMDIGFAEDSRDRFAIWMSYDPRIFRHESAGRLLDQCCAVLRLVCADPQLTRSDLRQRLGLAG